MQIVKLEHLPCPKVGGGGTNPLVPPTFESGEARAPPPAPLLLRPCKCSLKTPTKIFNHVCQDYRSFVMIKTFQKYSYQTKANENSENGRDLTKSYDIATIQSENKNEEITEGRHQNIDYTTTAVRLRTVSRYCHPTGMAKLVKNTLGGVTLSNSLK